MSIGTQVLIILVLVLANGVLAMAEIAIVSVRKVRLRHRAEEGDEKAAKVLALAEEPTRFLSTVQVGITLIGIFAGAFGGATLAGALALELRQFEPLAPYADQIALVLVVVAITYLSLVFGELVPKRIGLTRPEGIARVVVAPMELLATILRPAVRLLSISTDFVLALLRVRPSDDPPVTEGEISALLEVGTKAGVFEENERELVEGVFRLADLRVASLMTPRHRLVWLDINADPEDNWRRVTDSRHARYLVCDGELDALVGMVQATDLLAVTVNGRIPDLQGAILRKPLVVPESLRALGLLDLLRKSGTQFAVVVDEHGGTEGVITLQDVLEEVTEDLDPRPDPGIVRRGDGSMLMDGALTMDEVWEALELDQKRQEQRVSYNTLGGFVVNQLGEIPQAGQRFDAFGYTFEVVDMDGLRVDKVLISIQAEAADGEE